MPLTLHQRAAIRTSAVFVCFVTPGWADDPLAQAQVQYATQLGKPFRVLVYPGARLPEDAFAGVRDLEIIHQLGLDAERDAAQIKAWLDAYRQQEGTRCP